jgi:hypothetical protein
MRNQASRGKVSVTQKETAMPAIKTLKLTSDVNDNYSQPMLTTALRQWKLGKSLAEIGAQLLEAHPEQPVVVKSVVGHLQIIMRDGYDAWVANAEQHNWQAVITIVDPEREDILAGRVIEAPESEEATAPTGEESGDGKEDEVGRGDVGVGVSGDGGDGGGVSEPEAPAPKAKPKSKAKPGRRKRGF